MIIQLINNLKLSIRLKYKKRLRLFKFHLTLLFQQFIDLSLINGHGLSTFHNVGSADFSCRDVERTSFRQILPTIINSRVVAFAKKALENLLLKPQEMLTSLKLKQGFGFPFPPLNTEQTICEVFRPLDNQYINHFFKGGFLDYLSPSSSQKIFVKEQERPDFSFSYKQKALLASQSDHLTFSGVMF